jgi:hypothetical protein
VYIWVKVPLIVEVKVIIPQQNAPVQSYEITNEVTVIGVVGGLGVDVGVGLGVGLVIGGLGVDVGVGLGVGLVIGGLGVDVGVGLGVGLVIGGTELVVFRVVKRNKIIRIAATANIEAIVAIEATIIRSVLLEPDSDIFIIALTVRKLKFFLTK